MIREFNLQPAVWRMGAVVAAALALSACGSLPDKPVRPDIYDFGPNTSQSTSTPKGMPIALPAFGVPTALDSNAMVYRLAYSDAQVRDMYARARWSMPPSQLLRQKVRAELMQTHPVLSEGIARFELRVDLDEFSQVFESATQSHGLVRVRVTALAPSHRGERLLGQRSFVAKVNASTPDAPGGVQALSQASDQVARDIAQWVNAMPQLAAR